jgi:hypothetical protein
MPISRQSVDANVAATLPMALCSPLRGLFFISYFNAPANAPPE